MEQSNDCSLILSNAAGEQLVIGYDKQKQEYFIDRTRSGLTDFQKDFAGRHVAPCLGEAGNRHLSLIIDVSSVELFADGGSTVMTAIFFPTKPFNSIRIESSTGTVIKEFSYARFKSIWP